MKNQEMKIHLWYDDQAEQAAKFYLSIFDNSEIESTNRYGKEGCEIHGKDEGTVMTVSFRLNDMNFIALNGGPNFKFNESISIVIFCETQGEIDHYWEKLSSDPSAEQCGWLKDKFGVSWQVVPKILPQLLNDTNQKKSEAVMKIFLKMKKLYISRLQKAYNNG